MIELEKTAQVWCIYGNLGGGKTLTAVAMAVDALRQGYFVVSNVTLKLDELRREMPWVDDMYMRVTVREEVWNYETGDLISRKDLNPFTIPSGSPRGSGGKKRVLVILDECAEWFDQYSNMKDKGISRVMSWLRHSSKRSQDVIFIVQRREYLQKNFRILVSRWVCVDDLAVWRVPFLKMHLPFMGWACLARVFDKVGNRIQPLCLVKKSYYGKFYDTAENLSTFGGESFEYHIPPKVSTFPALALFFWLATLILLIFI